METKDYVKIFRLDQENFQFNRWELEISSKKKWEKIY